MTDPAAVGLGELPVIGPAAVSMGVFDGVHAGHRALLAATITAGERSQAASVVLVFHPHPAEVLRPGEIVPRLAPLGENLRRIHEAGISHAVPIRFDHELSQLPPEEFLAGLAPALEIRSLVMTSGSAFGHRRAGTLERMRELAPSAGWSVEEAPVLVIDGEPVSSTRLRTAVADGDLAAVHVLGGVAYLEGTVVVGDRRGRSLGFPTANLAFDYRPVMPPNGIWAARVGIPDRGVAPGHPALVSIGVRPTFHPDGAVLVEAHLLDFDADLYGGRLGLELVAWIRDERRFPSVEALVAQMHRDAEEGRRLLAA